MNRTRLEAKRAITQRLAKRFASGAADRLDQSSLYQRSSKVSQQWGDIL